MTVRHAASRLDEPGRLKALPGNQHARAKAERAGRSIWLFLQDASDRELRMADLERVPDLQIEPDQQGLLGQRTGVGEQRRQGILRGGPQLPVERVARLHGLDRKSTRLNSSHSQISYAVFCLKKKKKKTEKMSATVYEN